MAGGTFGDRLRELRKERGMQQRELGDLYNLSSSAIGSYERNLREPTLELLLQLSEYFGVSVDYLLCRTDEQPSALTVSTAEYHLLQLYRGLPGRYREAVNAAVHTIRKL